jgi:hypothetical protein
VPEHAPSEPSASDISPVDLLLPWHSGSQGCQRSRYLPMSATGNKYDCYYRASMNYKSFQDIALLAVKDLKRSQTPHENYAICSHFVRHTITAVLNMYVNASSNEMVQPLGIVTHKSFKTITMDYYVVLCGEGYTLCKLKVSWTN